MWTILTIFIEFVTQYCFCCMFWFFGHEACGILAPQPGIEPAAPALEGEVFWTAREVPSFVFSFVVGKTFTIQHCQKHN